MELWGQPNNRLPLPSLPSIHHHHQPLHVPINAFASCFGQSAVIGRGSHCGLSPLSSPRLGLQLSSSCCTKRSAETAVHGFRKKKGKDAHRHGNVGRRIQRRRVGWCAGITSYRHFFVSEQQQQTRCGLCFYALATQHARVGIEANPAGAQHARNGAESREGYLQ